jgi:hypothetical protein
MRASCFELECAGADLTLLELVAAVLEVTENEREASAAVDHLLRTRARWLRRVELDLNGGQGVG